MLLCAHYILPVTSDPILDGAILVRDGQIVEIGQASLLKRIYPDEEVMDFKESALMPGMVNLHMHLEDTVMRGIVPDEPYADWRRSLAITGEKLDARDWRSSAILGGLEALTCGITFVADKSTTGAAVTALQKLGMRGIVYREVGAVDKPRVEYAMRSAHNDILTWAEGADESRISIGIAPRPTYECHPLVFTRAAELACSENIPLSVSVASSSEECDFLAFGGSRLSVEAMREKRGFIEIPPWLPAGVSPVSYVAEWGGFEADNVLAVHCVHVSKDDVNMLKNQGVSVAVCPRTNAQLSMGVAPIFDLMRAGLTVGLGTGYSVAIDSTDLISEMRFGMLLQRAVNPGKFLDAHTMLRMATIDAARAIKMDDQIGSLEIGKRADIVAVDLSGSYQSPTDDPASAVVNTTSGSDVLMTMIDGKIRYEKGKWHLGADVAKDIARVIEIRGKLKK